MTWWGWVLLGWLPMSVVCAAGSGLALRRAELHEWMRRCRPERRVAERSGGPPHRA